MQVLCEYLKNPVGIDCQSPRFTWILEEPGCGKQESYRIRVYDCSCMKEESLVWDSGPVCSDRSVNVPYGGNRLQTATDYYYTVSVTDTEGNTFESEQQTFVTGLLEKDAWKADWLGGPWMEVNAFWFRTCFEISKPVRSAYVYVLSGNYYMLSVNGKKADDTVLQNANTDPDKTVLYMTYPVKDLLKPGKNAIGVTLANGWKSLLLGVNGVGLGEHSFSLQMLIRYEDGSEEWICSNNRDWKYTKEGPFRENSIYQGETYDARREIPGWDEADYDTDAAPEEWFDAVEFEPETGKIRAQVMEPIRVVATLEPVAVYEIGDGSYTFDMGQNFAGWARLKVRGSAGTEVRLVYSELIFEDHTVNQVSLRHMRCTDTYILKGEGTEEYEPSFTFHGFRYVQVFGLPEKPDKDTLTGCLVRSDVARIGAFSCSDELINQFHNIICWTEESNLHSIPTDCPQRNERLGWINDMSVRNECALYSYRLAALYTKFLGDIRDTQGEKTGAISDTAPFRVYGCRPADPVGISLFLVPWNMYRHYQDRRVIEENYPAMKKLFGYLERNSTNYTLRWATMGDWAAPIGDNDLDSIGGGAVSTVTPPRMVASASFYYCCSLMQKMASVLGQEADEAYYRQLSGKIREGFLDAWYDREKKIVYTGSQGSNTIALHYGLIPEEDVPAVMENLVKDVVETNHMHLTTGNICSRYLIEVLLKHGYEDVAFGLLTQRTYPSWGYMIDHGATTVWERWEEITDENTTQGIMCSYSHPMFGAAGVTFYKYLAGIDTADEKPGFAGITIRPVVPAGLSSAEASVDTLRGTVKNAWKKEADSFTMETVIPFNTSAVISVPVLNLENAVLTVNGTEAFADGACAGPDYDVKAEGGYLVLQVPAGSYTCRVCSRT